MNKIALTTAALLLMGTPAPAMAEDRVPLVQVSKSPHNQAQTVKRLKSAAAKLGWNVPKVFDMQATLRKHGHKVNPVQVINICKPDLAVKLLGKDAHRKMSVMMPCRISVYTDSKGKTFVSRMNVAALSRMLDGEVAKVMTAAGAGLEKIIAAALKH